MPASEGRLAHDREYNSLMSCLKYHFTFDVYEKRAGLLGIHLKKSLTISRFMKHKYMSV